MNKGKSEKGITLVALIITIVVLLILAMVTIGEVRESGIIGHAQDKTEKYNTAKEKEYSAIIGYQTLIEKNLPGGEKKEPISKEVPYIGYYADVDGDNTVDGIIYADLAFDGSGKFGSNINGEYSYIKNDTLDNYYISQEKYKYKSFKEKPVIAPIDKAEGNDRFYVMALEDFTTAEYTTFSWYKNAMGKINTIDTKTEFKEGRGNTKLIMEKWNANGSDTGYTGATQSDQDIWKHIQNKVSEGWFIPSREEWGAIGDFVIKQGLTKEKCAEYGFDTNYYWSSSQISTTSVQFVGVANSSFMANAASYNQGHVRLSTTF